MLRRFRPSSLNHDMSCAWHQMGSTVQRQKNAIGANECKPGKYLISFVYFSFTQKKALAMFLLYGRRIPMIQAAK